MLLPTHRAGVHLTACGVPGYPGALLICGICVKITRSETSGEWWRLIASTRTTSKMNIEFLQIILAIGALGAALAVAVVCGVGLIVWLAGGKLGQGKNRKAA